MEQIILNLGCGNQTYGNHRLDFQQTDATTDVCDLEAGLPFPDKFADKIYERNLLEHLRNVGFHLTECYRVLKVGGELELITDNAQCLRFYLFGTHTGRYERVHVGDFHYEIFTKNHLKNHIQHSGFTIKELKYEKTDTLGRFLDCPLSPFLMPRLKVIAIKE